MNGGLRAGIQGEREELCGGRWGPAGARFAEGVPCVLIVLGMAKGSFAIPNTWNTWKLHCARDFEGTTLVCVCV